MKNLILGGIAILIIGVGGYFALKDNSSNNEQSTKIEGNIIKTAWVEVERGTLFLKLPGQAKELKSGDTIESGASLETGKNSAAIIHFPDGSILSMDKETSITIPQIEVNDESKGILIKITLTVGRVWSKVISLATPESEWEVKTSNTVATVRGTAFGMGFSNGKSWINTSENKVAISPLDPETKEKIADAEVIIDDKKYVEIDNSIVASVLKEVSTSTETGVDNPKKAFLVSKIADVPRSITDDNWVKQVKEKHKEIDSEIKEIESKIQDRKDELKDKLMELAEEKRKAVRENRKLDVKKTIERITEKQENVYERKEEIKTENNTQVKITTTEATQTTRTETARVGLLDSDKILVLTNDKLSVEEGQTIQFKAYALRDGGNVDVSELVNWQVAGPIGVITKPGIFVARLGSEASELGQSVGTVIVLKKDSDKILSTSAPINVKAAVVSRPLEIGGQ